MEMGWTNVKSHRSHNPKNHNLNGAHAIAGSRKRRRWEKRQEDKLKKRNANGRNKP